MSGNKSKGKWNRLQVGTITKKSDDRQKFEDIKEFTLKINQDITLKAGTYLNLENKVFKKRNLEANRDKMSQEVFDSAMEKVDNMPDWVVFEVVQLSKNE